MIYVTGDVHREQDIHKINPREFIPGRTMTPDDFLIICGDFGCIWDDGDGDRFWLNWLESLPWVTLFADGNHENFDVLKKYPIVDFHGGKARQIRSNIFQLLRGEVYDLDGEKFFTFGGGFSHDVHYRTEGKNWWQDELPDHEEVENARRNLEKHNWKVDHVITHDLYKSHPLTSQFPTSMENYGPDREDIQEVLEDIEKRLDYKNWFNGHYHCDVRHNDTYTLFDHVIRLDKLAEQTKDFKTM